MNILHISPDFNYSCGVSKYVFLLLKELARTKEHKLFFITNGGDSMERLNQVDVKVSYLKITRGNYNPLNYLMNLFSLIQFCLKEKIEIIHSHHRYAELLAVVVSKLIGIKTITTAHSLVKGMRSVSFKSDRIIAVSKTVETELQNYFRISAHKIIQLYNFVEPFNSVVKNDSLELRQKIGLSEDDRVLLFVGRINYFKGIDVLLSAFTHLAKKYPNLKLILVGQIDELELAKMISKLKNVIHIKPQKEVSSFYEICELVILPSMMESFPYTMIEAGLIRKPFIGSNTGGIAEFIQHGENGLLVNPGDATDLAEKIESLLCDRVKAKLLSDNLFYKIESLIDAKSYIDKINFLYSPLHDRKNK